MSSTDRLAVIADLLVNLPEAKRREVIAELVPSDRAAAARMLIRQKQEANTPGQVGEHLP